MFRFFAYIAVVTAAMSQAHAEAPQTIIYKHNHWPLSILEFRAEMNTGPVCAYAYRYSWPRRMSDAYGLYDAEGEAIAEAAFTGRGLASYTFAGAQMRVTGPDGALLGRVKGQWNTSHRAFFTLSGEDDQPLAVAYADYFGDDIFIVDAETQHKVLATLTYLEPLPSMDAPYWTFTQYDTEALPPALSHAFISYMVDYQSWANGYGLSRLLRSMVVDGAWVGPATKVIP